MSSRPIRVLYLLNSPGGGATLGIVELLKGLPRDRYWSCVVVPQPPNENQARTFAELADELHVVPTATWHFASNLPRLHQVLAMLRTLARTSFHLKPIGAIRELIRSRSIDIVYTCTVMEIDAAFAARLEKKPHIWHVKEWLGRDGRVVFPAPDSMAARIFEGLSSRVIAMSDFIAQFFRTHGADGNLLVIPDGVDAGPYSGEAGGGELRAQLGVGEGQVLIGMTAALSATWKQHDLFVDAAARVARARPDARFVAFGSPPRRTGRAIYDRPWFYHESLLRRVEQAGLKDQFIWAGFHNNIPQMMDALDILVHPCSNEPFGRVAIEAMAAAKPVVGPTTGGISETVVSGDTGILAPAEPDAFASAILQLIDDADLRRRLGEGGRRRVREFYGLDQHARAVAGVYDELLREGRGASR